MPNPISFTLGWELEACRAARMVPEGIIRERDGSVSGDATEYKIAPELVTSPARALQALQALTSDVALHVNRTCGFHVHIGVNGRPRAGVLKQWASAFVLLARRVEPFAFLAVPPSRRANQFCRAWSHDSGSVIVRRYNSHKYSNDSRYLWVNVVEIFRPGGIRTVEVRLLGSTKRYPYLLAWTALCHKMAQSAWRLISDPSALEIEVQALRHDFEQVAAEVLPNRDPATVARIALQLAVDAQLMTDQDARDLLARLTAMARVRRADPAETAETRFTEAQAWVELGRMEDEDAAHCLVVNERYNDRPRRPRRVRASQPAPLSEHIAATLNPELIPDGFNPDAFAVIPNNGGTR